MIGAFQVSFVPSSWSQENKNVNVLGAVLLRS